MTALADHLAQQIETQAQATRDLLRTRTRAINQAEALADKLQSAGVMAVASGRVDWPHILVWVGVTPRSLEQLDDALTRLDLRETARYPGAREFDLTLEGYDVPIYVTNPE